MRLRWSSSIALWRWLRAVRDRPAGRSSRRAGNPPFRRRSFGRALQVLDRRGHVAPVLLQHGGVVEVLGLGQGRAGVRRCLSQTQVDAGAIDELLLVGVLLDEIQEVPLRLVELLLLEGRDAPVVVLPGVLGVLGELLQGLGLLRRRRVGGRSAGNRAPPFSSRARRYAPTGRRPAPGRSSCPRCP